MNINKKAALILSVVGLSFAGATIFAASSRTASVTYLPVATTKNSRPSATPPSSSPMPTPQLVTRVARALSSPQPTPVHISTNADVSNTPAPPPAASPTPTPSPIPTPHCEPVQGGIQCITVSN